MKLSDVF